MKRLLFAIPVAILAASPAQATGGLTCKTAGPRPVEVSIGFGHVVGAPLIGTRLIDNGRVIAVTSPQWWLEQSELRLLLANAASTQQEALIRARRNGHVYDGTLLRGGKRRWVRCRES